MNRVEIIFTKDFGEYSKGDKAIFDPMLASGLIRYDKVAKLTDEEAAKFKKLEEEGAIVEARAQEARDYKKASELKAKKEYEAMPQVKAQIEKSKAEKELDKLADAHAKILKAAQEKGAEKYYAEIEKEEKAAIAKAEKLKAGKAPAKKTASKK